MSRRDKWPHWMRWSKGEFQERDCPLKKQKQLRQAYFLAIFSSGPTYEYAKNLSFFLEFWVFPWVLINFLSFTCKSLDFSSISLSYSYKLPLEFNFSRIFVNKNAIKSPPPSKILSFDRKIEFFSWIFLIGG